MFVDLSKAFSFDPTSVFLAACYYWILA